MSLWNIYKVIVERNCLGSYNPQDGLLYWRNRLFASIILFWVPISFLAVIPGVIMSFIGGIPSLAIIDTLLALSVVFIAFNATLSIFLRKILFIGVLYVLSIVLIYYLGSYGPGLLYLLGITVFIVLIFPGNFGYWSVVINLLICILFRIAIYYKLINGVIEPLSSFGSWIAISSNLVLLSLIISTLLPKLFNGLQNTIELQKRLENELIVKQDILKGSEKRFRLLIENAGDVIALFDRDGKFVYTSPAFERITGYTAEELIDSPFSMIMENEQAEKSRQFLKTIKKKPSIPLHNLTALRHKKGNRIWMEGIVTNLLNDKNIEAIICNYHDITRHKKDEEKIVRANRMYAFISAINQTIVHTSDKKTLFKNVCDIAIELGKFKMVWIGSIDKENNRINLVEKGGIIAKDLRLFEDVLLTGNSPENYILRKDTFYLSNDIQNDPRLILYKDYAKQRGINSCMILPVRQHGEIVAILHLYSTESFFFDEIEIRLLEEVAGDISFALDVFEKDRLRREGEERIMHSETRLIEAQAIAKVGSWEIDLLQNTEVWSDELYKIYHLNKDEVTLSTDLILSLTHPDDIAFANNKIKQAFSTFEDVSFDYRFIIKSGQIRYAYTEWRFQLDENENLIRIYGIVQDITEKKEAEEKSRADEIRYQTLFEQAADAISVTDAKGNIFEVNKSMCNMLGYSKEEFHHLKVKDLLFEEDTELNPPRVRNLKPGEEVRYERRLKRKNGTEVYIDMSGTTMSNGRNLVFARDITEKRIAAQQKEFDRKNFDALINSTDDLMWSVDRNMDLITCNKAFEEMIRQMTGRSIQKGSSFIKTDISQEQLNHYEAFFARAFSGEIFTETVHTVTPFEIWSEISFYPIRQGDEIIGSACYSRNITALKHAEQERIKMTNDIIERNKNLEQFAYIVSHNLRAPVANISGLTYVMQTMELDKKEEKVMVDELSNSVKKLDNVIHDLNHILQIKGGVYEEKETVNFSELLEDIKVSIGNLITKEQVEIISDFSEVNEFITIKSYIYSIFYNLISNSIKYRRTDTGSFIKIKSIQSKNKIELIFKDNGLGIDLGKKGDQVFGLYKRFHFHTEGKGMGLYMVKTQVETLGGKISLDSEVNKGTTFRIEFEVNWTRKDMH